MKKLLLTILFMCLVGCSTSPTNKPETEKEDSNQSKQYTIQYEMFDNDFNLTTTLIDFNVKEELSKQGYNIQENDGIYVEAVSGNEVYISVCDKAQYISYNTKAIYKYNISTHEFTLLKSFSEPCRVFDICKFGDDYMYSIYQIETSMNQVIYGNQLICECPASYLECSQFNQYDDHISFLQSYHDDHNHKYSVTYYQVKENDVQSKLIFETESNQDSFEYLFNNDLYTNGNVDILLTVQSGPKNLYIIDQMNIDTIDLSNEDLAKINLTCCFVGNDIIIDNWVYDLNSKEKGTTELKGKYYREVTLNDQYFIYNNVSNVTNVAYLNNQVLKTTAVGLNSSNLPKFIYKVNDHSALIAVDDLTEYMKLYLVEIS